MPRRICAVIGVSLATVGEFFALQKSALQ